MTLNPMSMSNLVQIREAVYLLRIDI